MSQSAAGCYLVVVDKVVKRAMRHAIAAQEAVLSVAGVNHIVLALEVSAVRQDVSPDVVAQSDEVRSRTLCRQNCFRLLPCDEACNRRHKETVFVIIIIQCICSAPITC